jgi:CheY-like chemotaxis protein
MKVRPPIILLAEDDEDDRMMVARAMKQSNAQSELRTVENGAELLDYLHGRGSYAGPEAAPRPDVILLDLNMPGKGGLAAIREIRSEGAFHTIPVVVLSTSSASSDVASAYASGANSFIEKPGNFAALTRIMRTIEDYWFGVVRLPLAGRGAS